MCLVIQIFYGLVYNFCCSFTLSFNVWKYFGTNYPYLKRRLKWSSKNLRLRRLQVRGRTTLLVEYLQSGLSTWRQWSQCFTKYESYLQVWLSKKLVTEFLFSNLMMNMKRIGYLWCNHSRLTNRWSYWKSLMVTHL